ncbi:MAG: hypothetical protein HKN68_16180 [Saprospiraceae bacterium]|nr:hypothetical protein [Saprospiraceae bacterium]
MSYHYSILKISINQDLEDTISIGLLLLSKDRYWFKYSQDRLKYLKPFLGVHHAAIVKVLNIISRKINSIEGFQLDLYSPIDDYFNEEFLQHLSKQHIGMVRFSNPEPIVLTSVNQEVFDGVYKSLIGEEEKRKIRRKNPEKKIIERKLIKPLVGKVHTHIKLDGSSIPELYFRYDLEACGRNDHIFLVKYLDFNQTPPTLDMKIMRLLFLSRLMSQVFKTKTRVFVIASEPPIQNHKRHQLYKFVARNELLEIKTPDECPQVAALFAEAEMRKFIK